MGEEIESWYKTLSVILFLFLALPIAGYIILPNTITYSLFFPVSIIIVSIHEFGHVVPYMFSSLLGIPWESARFIVVAGGTVSQLLIPMLFFIYFAAVNRRYALAYIFLVLLGGSLYYAGDYMSTAQAPTGLAVTSFGSAIKFESDPESHDWRFMLTTLNLLEITPDLSKFIINFSYVLTMIGAFSAALETNMILNGNRTKDFMIVLLYGTVPTFLLSFLYFDGTKFIISLLFFIASFAYFLVYKVPEFKKEYEEAKEEEQT
jgi:hypothetical protein